MTGTEVDGSRGHHPPKRRYPETVHCPPTFTGLVRLVQTLEIRSNIVTTASL